jgi:hypothetical protein
MGCGWLPSLGRAWKSKRGGKVTAAAELLLALLELTGCRSVRSLHAAGFSVAALADAIDALRATGFTIETDSEAVVLVFDGRGRAVA